ncbi:MAG TPA: chain length determinant protein tyrosine kinase EpsG [Burkholderiales bacterium]|nr:chain length determinant protein tyrosine kinase EpsG [Burkholderiales bacterium]
MTLDSTARVVGPERNIGSILIEEGKLTESDTRRIVDLQRAEGLRFGEAAIWLGLISDQDLQLALARQYDFPQLPSGDATVSPELVAAYAPFHRRVEELRALRTQLLIRWFNSTHQRRVLAIVSPETAEGRTYVSANLAIVFSQLGERTLLIDADLRSPRQHRLFNVPDRVGLSTVLSGRVDYSAIVPVPGFAGLSLLPAGAPPPNPQELLSRAVLPRFLQEMQSKFDVILIDTPPAKLYADAQSVTYHAGGAVVLARKNHTRLVDTKNVIRDMNDTGAQIVGAIMNSF